MDGSLIEPTQYLYTGHDYEACGDLIISDQAAPVFVPSVEVSRNKNPAWTSIMRLYHEPIAMGMTGEFDILASSPLPAQMQYGLVDGLSTLAMYFDNFIGRIQLQGCLCNNVPTDNENYKWFIIKFSQILAII